MRTLKSQRWIILFLLLFGCGGEDGNAPSVLTEDLVGTWEGEAVVSGNQGQSIIQIKFQIERTDDDTQQEFRGNFTMQPCLPDDSLTGKIEGKTISLEAKPPTILALNPTAEQIIALTYQITGKFEGGVTAQSNFMEGLFSITMLDGGPQECKISGRWVASKLSPQTPTPGSII